MTIGERFREVVFLLREIESGPPYYMYGHRREIAQRLQAFDKSITRKDKKFPLIVLISDTPSRAVEGVYRHVVQIVLVTYSSTKKNRNAEQRATEVIEPTLEPLYNNLKRALSDSGLFMWPGDPLEPPHVRTDRPNWGAPSEESNMAQYFSDPVDGIEMSDLELNEVICGCPEDTAQDQANNVKVITAQETVYIG